MFESLAKRQYAPVGKNAWPHIRRVLSTMKRMARKLRSRELSLDEEAAALFHDLDKVHGGFDHGAHAAELSAKLLDGCLTKKQICRATALMRFHDRTPDEVIKRELAWRIKVHWWAKDNPAEIRSAFRSLQLLQAADAAPADLCWYAHKCWEYQLRRVRETESVIGAIGFGPTVERSILQRVLDRLKSGSGPLKVAASNPYYAEYYAEALRTYRRQLEGLRTVDDLKRLLAVTPRWSPEV